MKPAFCLDGRNRNCSAVWLLFGPWISFCNAACLSSNPFTQFFHSIHYSMKTEVKKNRQWSATIVWVLLISIISGFTNPSAIEPTCPGPHVYVTSQSSGSVSFSWNTVSGGSEYVVFYIRQPNSYTSQQTYTYNTSITYSGLPSGTYSFYFAAVCGGELSEIIIIDDLVL